MNFSIKRSLERLPILYVLTLVLWSGNLSAATWYSVELLIFQNLNAPGAENETWPQDPGMPDLVDAVELGPGGFSQMGSGQFRLRSIASRMLGSGAYRPLLHVGWSQAGYTRTRARKVHIHSGLSNPYSATGYDAIDGTVSISRARFLHLEADLVLNGRLVSDSIAQAQSYRLTAKRRMRSREIHYIDHPMFGMLINIVPHATVETEVFDDDTATE